LFARQWQEALQKLQGDVSAELHFQPFELNPKMGPEGQDIGEHLAEKYGSTPEQQAQIRNTIRARGAEVGFAFNPERRGRIWNTFDAHRLLHWAGEEGAPGQQHALKKALMAACHTRSEAMGHHDVLLGCVREAGLDEARAKAILASDEFAQDVRERFSREAVGRMMLERLNAIHGPREAGGVPGAPPAGTKGIRGGPVGMGRFPGLGKAQSTGWGGRTTRGGDSVTPISGATRSG